MTKAQLEKKKIPDAPGVYFFLGSRKEILYIGKATSLRNRIRSYFSNDLKEKRSELIENMVAEAKSVEWTETGSVLEALILETNLIRTHKPQYNTISKDDKSYNHLIITNEDFPRVLVIRGKDLTDLPAPRASRQAGKYTEKEINPHTYFLTPSTKSKRAKRSQKVGVGVKYHFGPFPSGTLFKEALKVIKKIFKFYDTKRPVEAEKSKLARGTIDFNRQIGLYPDTSSKEEYKKTIRHIQLFFEGKKETLIKELTKDMMRAAKEEKFEEADAYKKKLFALTHIQDIALIRNENKLYRDEKTVRIEAYDVAHHGGNDMVGVMTVTEAGEPKKSEYRKFKIQSIKRSNDSAALKQILDRRIAHPEWPYPQIIVVDGSTAQKNAAEHVLRKVGITIPVVAVVKDEKHKPKRIMGPSKLLSQFQNDILLANSEAHRFAIAFHRSKSRKRKLS